MIRWQPRQTDRLCLSIVLLIIAGLGVLIAISGVGALQPAEVLRVLSAWGFAEELLVATLGLVALAFLAGRGRKELVVVGGIVVILAANSTLASPSNMLTTYPTHPGMDRATLLELAEQSPNTSISNEIPVLLRLGEQLGTSRLVMPLSDLGDRVRALTEIDVVFEPGPYDLGPTDWGTGQEKEIGMMGTVPMLIAGSGDEYVWVDGPGAIFIVGSDLLTETSS